MYVYIARSLQTLTPIQSQKQFKISRTVSLCFAICLIPDLSVKVIAFFHTMYYMMCYNLCSLSKNVKKTLMVIINRVIVLMHGLIKD